MTIHRLAALVALPAVLALLGCDRSSPTEQLPTPTVHVVGENTATIPIFLQHYANGATVYPVEVAPGGRVELDRWNRISMDGARFLVYRATGNPSSLSAWAEVKYDFHVSYSDSAMESTVTVRVTSDPFGNLDVTSERPDLLQIVSVSYNSGPGARQR